MAGYRQPWGPHPDGTHPEREITIERSADALTADTLGKVYAALHAAGLTPVQVLDAITEILNAGIVFRERSDPRSRNP